MPPRESAIIRHLLQSARSDELGVAIVVVEPMELRSVFATDLRPGVHLNVVTPRTLRGDGVPREAVSIYCSGSEIVVDVARYRERDEWELPISPEGYERPFEHVVTIREEAHDESSATDGRARYYRPQLSPTDIRLTIGILLPADQLSDLSIAYAIGLKIAAQVHAEALSLALRDAGRRVIRDARPDPAIPPSDYLRLGAEELQRRRTAFEDIMAKAPAAVHGVFEDGLVTVELVRVAPDSYQIGVRSILARAGKIKTMHPIPAKEVAFWCQRAGAPIDAFEWRTNL